MFTGLVEEVGQVQRIDVGEKLTTISILAKDVLCGLKLGDSVAINGVCLTVTSFNENSFCADIIAQTWKVTSFSNVQQGSFVNLERSLKVSDRLGGHFVSGHVDTCVSILNIEEEPGAYNFTIELPADYESLIIPKGSIAVNGISLTVADLHKQAFVVSIIPFTLKHTNFSSHGKRR